MRSYRRILALVALNADSEAVARRALQLSRFYGATLAVASVVDYTPGFECDHIPFKTPDEMRRAVMQDVRTKLDQLVTEIGCAGACEVIVACGAERAAVAKLTHSWHCDLVVVGSRSPLGLDKRGDTTPFDVLVMHTGRQSLVGRLIDALSAAL